MDTQSLNPYFFANSNPNPNKMGADSLAEKIPQIPQNLSAQAQKFWISMKKSFIGRP